VCTERSKESTEKFAEWESRWKSGRAWNAHERGNDPAILRAGPRESNECCLSDPRDAQQESGAFRARDGVVDQKCESCRLRVPPDRSIAGVSM